jgi:type IV pilus assembly protein PilW
MSLRNLASRRPPPHQHGYTLLEILVALFIGIFLLVGLFTILQNTRRSSGNQTALTQLQDEQRMAMSLLNDVIQNAGYFDPNTITSAAALPAQAATGLATGYALSASQGISGSHPSTTTPGDIILIRYATNGTASTVPDGVENCNGGTSTTAATFTNTFFVASTSSGGVATTALWCSLDGSNSTTTGIPLINGVQNMQIYYGVSTVVATNNVDTYMTGTQVQGSTLGWAAVTSVRVTLTFLNPLYRQAGYTAATSQYVYFTRVIPIQGRTGVIATAL